MMIAEQWWYFPVLFTLMFLAYAPMLYQSIKAMLKWADTYSDLLVSRILERKKNNHGKTTNGSD